jgi:hypothetical protein
MTAVDYWSTELLERVAPRRMLDFTDNPPVCG